ncbi:hypothetical protein [Enterococcus sp. AZ163]|uniref:hypothetical protein n=1 Tax=Enterococcus sp. AZ163 TaxID=2774638 RepID=UPI003D2DC81B
MILIQQTPKVNVKKVFSNLEPCLSLDKLQKLPLDELQETIQPAGFHHQKSKSINDLLVHFVSHSKELEKFGNYKT